jgi:YHS domain-containing protein
MGLTSRRFFMIQTVLLTLVVATAAPALAAPGPTESDAAESEAAHLANPMCPVMPAEPADDVFHLVYKGRDVHFCCSTCIQYFRKNPKKYLARLEQYGGWEADDPSQAVGGLTAKKVGGGGAQKLQEVWMGSLMAEDLVPFGALAIPGFGLFLYWRRRRLGAAGFRSVVALHVAWFAFFTGAIVATSFARNAYDLYNLWKDRDRVHFSTFFEFGHPPVPSRPEQPKSLKSTYYRGNDERTPALFNNGRYRTSTMHLSLEDESGAAVKPGDDVTGKQLYVKLITERAPFTAERFFHPRAMEPIYLTKRSDPFLGAFEPVPDRVPWTERKERWEWEARYAIGQVSPRPAIAATLDLQSATVDEIAAAPGVGAVAAQWLVKYRDWNDGIGSTADLIEAGIEGGPLAALSDLLDSEVLKGVVYVAQFIPKGNDLSNIRGSRFHYGMVYDVRLREGIVQPDSDLWMNYLYRSRKTAAWRIPAKEWFDNEPIPELPSKATDDPALLGLDDDDQGIIPLANETN